MQKLYCTIFIVDVSQNPEEVETISSRIIQLIEDHGGVIKRHNPWGKRRLAYPIRKKTSGYYVEIEFLAHSHLNIPQIIEQEYRLNDRVLRYLTYVVTKDELRQRELNAKRAKAGAAEAVAPVSAPSADVPPPPVVPESSPAEETPEKVAETDESPAAEEASPKTEETPVEEKPAEEAPVEETPAEEKAAEEPAGDKEEKKE